MAAVDLPQECWELVFLHLTQPSQWASISLTCKNFLILSNLLRPSLRISSSPSALPGGLNRILKRFRGLHDIDLHDFHGNLARPLLEISRSGLQLRVLDLHGAAALPKESIVELGKSCLRHSLRSLNCSRIHLLRDEDLCAIGQSFPLLEHLDISHPALRPTYDASITDAGIASLVGYLPNLRVINLSGNYFISDVAMAAISISCRGLKELVLFDCPLVTDHGLHLIATQCSELASLAVNGARISSSGIKTLLCTAAANLQHLDLSLLTISDELPLNLAELRLKRLVLARCKGMTSMGIVGLARFCPELVHLNLEGAHWLSDEVMETLARGLSNLTYICLNYCSLLTDSTFFSLLRSCRKLEELEMESTGLGWGNTSAMRADQ